MKPHTNRQIPWSLIIVFLLLVAGTLITGLSLYRSQQQHVLSDTQKNLETMAELKTRQIAEWRSERLSDGLLIQQNVPLIRLVDSYFKATKKESYQKDLLATMKSILLSHEYESIVLADVQQRPYLSLGTYGDSIGTYGRSMLREALLKHTVVLSDLHKSGPSPFPHLDIIIPFHSPAENGTADIGAFLVRVNPAVKLFSLIQSWAIPSQSAEAILVERQGDEVVYLNDLRHRKNTTLMLRFPITNQQLLAARSARGEEGVVEGTDYRGVYVLGVIKKVPETPWSLITKIDRNEIEAPLKAQAWIVGFGMFLIILASGAMLGVWWRQQRVRYYREQYELELENKALKKHFEYLVLYANDIILLLDNKGNIREANNRATDLYGYSHEEFLWLNIRDLRAPATRAEVDGQLEMTREQGGIIFETQHVRKDGTSFPVEVSSRSIEIEGTSFIQSIIRDITERKMVEDILRESTEEIQDLYNNAPCGYHSLNNDGVFVRVNDTELRWTGYTREELMNTMKFADILAPKSLEKFREVFQLLKETGVINDAELNIIKKNGTLLPVSLNATAIKDANGIFVMSRSSLFDISDRKTTEKKILQLNRIYSVLSNINQMIVRTRDRQSIFNGTCQIAVDDGKFQMAWIGLVDENTHLIVPVAKAGITDGFFDDLQLSVADSRQEQGPIANAIRTGNHFITNDIEHDDIASTWKERALALDYRSAGVFPIKVFNNIIGTLNLYTAEVHYFDKDELRLLDELTMDLGYALETVELDERRRQAEESLSQSHSLLQATLESTADGILVVDQSGKVTSANKQFVTMWNIPEPLLASGDDNRLLSFVLDQLIDPNMFINKVKDLYNQGELDSYDIIEFKDGKTFERYSHPQRIHGKPVGRVWSFRDITERKQAETTLVEEHNLLHTLIDTLPDNIFIKDLNGRILIDNLAHRTQFGLPSQEEVLGKTDFDFFSKELATAYSADEQKIIRSGKPLINHEELASYADGSHKWKLTTKVPLRDKSEKIIGIVGINHDITQRKKAEEELYHANQMLQLIFDNIPQRIFWKDKESRFLGCNKLFANDAGCQQPSELIGKTDFDMSWKETADLYRTDDALVMKTNSPKLNYEEPQNRPDGSVLWLRTNKIPLHDQKGEVIGILGTYEDITEHKKIEEQLRENEEKYRLLFELESDALFLIDNETGQILESNAAVSTLYGYNRDELVHMHNFDLSAEPNETQRTGADQSVVHIPIQYHRKKDGTVFPVEITAARLMWRGRPAHMPAIRDITERLRIEENIRESEDKFRSLAEQSPNMIFINEKGRIVYANKRCEEIMGYVKDEFYSPDFNFFDMIDENDRMSLEMNFKSYMHGDEVPPIEYTLLTKDHKKIEVILSTKLIRYCGDHAILGTITDITEQKKVEHALRQSEALFKMLVESSPVAITVFSGEVKSIEYISNRFTELFGYDRQDISSMDTWWLRAYPNDDYRTQIQQIWQNALEQKQSDQHASELVESLITCKDGSTKYIESTLISMGDLTVLFFADLTQRRLTEEALRQTYTFNELLIQTIPFGIDIVDEEGKILFMSTTLKKLVKDNALDSCCWEIYRDNHERCENCPMKGGISFGKPDTIETPSIFGGKTYQISHVGMMYEGKKAVLEVFQDITEQKKLQQELLQSQKLLSIGTMAGGIAHDFNNILGIILGYISILPSLKENQQRFSDGVNAIKQAVDRGAALVRQILTFARKTDVAFKPLNMSELVHELVSMLQQTFPKLITFNALVEKRVPDINADPAQIHQALLNLCVNARDAMPNGGEITIHVETIAGEIVRNQFPNAIEQWYESVSVKDTGLGMDDTTRNQVFDPFFTTKEKGKGTGLGLSVVYGIIQAHHGFVDVTSSPDQGTIFTLYFPVPRESTDRLIEQTKGEEDALFGNETILVVEDEVLLLDMMHILLETHGYTVLTAEDGQEAVALYKAHADDIALVLTDMGLPKLTGIDEFEKLKEINPSVKLIFASGYIEPEMKTQLIQAGAKDFLQKPYVLTEVLTKIRKALEPD